MLPIAGGSYGFMPVLRAKCEVNATGSRKIWNSTRTSNKYNNKPDKTLSLVLVGKSFGHGAKQTDTPMK